MLRQFPITPVPKDFDRRWITDDFFDLYVWYNPDQTIHGFQLCYDKPGTERAFTWTPAGGAQHAFVDSGEQLPETNSAPVLNAGGAFNAEAVLKEFISRSCAIDSSIRDMVIGKLQEQIGAGGKPPLPGF